MRSQRFYLFLTYAVLTTIIFGWLRLNSLFMLLLAGYKLWDNRPLKAVKAALSNKYVWAYLAFFLIEAAGQLHAHNLKKGADIVAKDATLVAIAFIVCAGRFIDERGYRQLMTGFCFILVAASVTCLVAAAGYYMHDHDIYDFFYHSLTRPLSQNAVFFSVYVLFGALYLLSPGGVLLLGERFAAARRPLQLCLIIFFIGMIILLSSKLILVILLIIVAAALQEHYSLRRNPRVIMAFSLAGLVLVGLLVFTGNPVKARFQEMMTTDLDKIRTERFTPGDAFNYLQLRVLEWHFAGEVLNEHHAWLFGVSPGDSQDLLDRKYVDANMYIGDSTQGPARHVRGFLGYNYHNQYIETLVRDGIVGLLALLTIFWLLWGIVWRWKTRAAFFTVATLVLFFIPESPLTMQDGIILFSFFPLVLLHSPRQRIPGTQKHA
jgi:O-antigen ligase